MPVAVRPDPSRLGGIDWLESTNGSLTSAERRRLLGRVARGQAQGLAERVRGLTGGRGHEPGPIPSPPDSAIARAAEDACGIQSPVLIAHSYRTWAFGRALASVDGDERLDDEIFYVAALLHDTGLMTEVAGEDFTLRSARAAAECVDGLLADDDTRHVQDAIAAHTTPGLSADVDGVEAFYLQAGATLDLGGLRLPDLPDETVATILAHRPRAGLTDEITARIRGEARAVPDGRFAVLARSGFLTAIKLAPFEDR